MTDTITGFTVTDSIEPDSSLVAYAAWDASTDTLGLVFHNREDDAYLYNVAPEIWKAFKNSYSKGSYYNQYIKSYYGPGTVVDVEAIRVPEVEAVDFFAEPVKTTFAVGDKVLYVGDWYSGLQGIVGTIMTVEDPKELVFYDYRVAFEGVDLNGHGRLCRVTELTSIPALEEAAPVEAAPPILPVVGTRVNVKTDTGVEGPGTVTAHYGRNGYDLMVSVDNHNTMPVYLSEVSPIEESESANPYSDQHGPNTFTFTIEVSVKDAPDRRSAEAWLNWELSNSYGLSKAFVTGCYNTTAEDNE
jgi:hypothetical protein